MDAAAAEGTSLAIVIWSAFSALMCLVYIVPLLIAAVSITIWVIALVDLAKRDPADFPQAHVGKDDPNERMLWVLAVVLGGAVGSLIYYFLVMRAVPRKSHPPVPATEVEDAPRREE